jgi:hypothetical protein
MLRKIWNWLADRWVDFQVALSLQFCWFGYDVRPIGIGWMTHCRQWDIHIMDIVAPNEYDDDVKWRESLLGFSGDHEAWHFHILFATFTYWEVS